MSTDTKNLAVVRQSFAQCVFTHQVQEAASNRMQSSAKKYKIVNIVLVSVVLVLLVVQAFFPQNLVLTYISAGITAGEIIFLVVQLTFSVEQQSVLHKNSALKYMSLRDRYKNLLADIVDGTKNKHELLACRDALQVEYQTVSDMSPITSSNDYDQAQESLGLDGKGEQYTWSDKEINRFLPKELWNK
jgi:hypothetical protein